MTDGINNNVRRPVIDNGSRGASKSENKPSLGLFSTATTSADSTPTPVKASGADQLHLSNVSKRLADEPGFDRVKVDSIKKAIEDGNYPLDPRRIAESFHAIEQMIGD
jgi:negative regulator of flagellin synthesis FlgM